jgi:hypothetical protein
MARIHPLPERWLPIAIAPADTDLELCVIDQAGIHALVFPCRKRSTEWVDAVTHERVDIDPTHWRKWNDGKD